MPEPAKAPTPQPTSFAGGRYQVKKFLGEGGKKKVYLAHDATLDRDVAFALIKTEKLDDVTRTRITREAQSMGRLGDHPNIVTVYDFDEHEGQPYIVLPVLPGGDVEGLIDKAPDHCLPLDKAIEIARSVCKGLEFAHAKGIIHRDLKPGNVWLSADSTAKIGDFGLAVAVDLSRLTQSGMMVGTVPGSSLVMGNWPESQRAAVVAAFDAATIQGTPSELSLRLTTSVTDSTLTEENQNSAGPFILDFTIPFHAGKVVDINQTMETSGIPITLERLIISPWATQAVFSFVPPYDNLHSRPLIVAFIQPVSGDTVNSALGKTKGEASAEYFIGDLIGQTGEWTITVKELVFPPESPTPGTHPASFTKRLADPWEFKIQLK